MALTYGAYRESAILTPGRQDAEYQPGVLASRRPGVPTLELFMKTRALVFAAMIISAPATAQVPDAVPDMMRRIFASADFSAQRFGPARWLDSGAAYTTVER